MVLFGGIKYLGSFWFFLQRFEELKSKEKKARNQIINSNSNKDAFLEKSEEIWKGIKTLIKFAIGKGRIIKSNGVNSSNFYFFPLAFSGRS